MSGWQPPAGTSVLVADEGNTQSRSALAAVRALGEAGLRAVVTTAGRPSLAARSRHCSRTLAVPPGCGPGFAEAVARALEDPSCLTVLPASDLALQALGAPGAELVDKQVLGERARSAGIPVPAERVHASVAELVRAAQGLTFPLVVKPVARRAGASGSAVRVDRAADLERLLEGYSAVVVQEWVDAPMSAVAGVVRGGRLVASAHQRYLRTWPRVCGVASAAVTTEPDLGRERDLLRLLDGYDGIFQAQFVGPFLVDLNPRVYGSLPLAVAAGANLPAVWCALLAGAEPGLVRARAGVAYRWTEGDVRHVGAAVASREMTGAAAVRALLPGRRVAHSVGAVHDPQPLLSRTAHLARRLA